MSDPNAGLRRLVVERAGNRCEYCRLAQEGQEATFHIDQSSRELREERQRKRISRWRVFRAR